MIKLLMGSFVAIGAIFMLPALMGIVDLLWWFWADHAISNIDWAYNNGIRGFLAGLLVVVGCPLFCGTLSIWSDLK